MYICAHIVIREYADVAAGILQYIPSAKIAVAVTD